ncbi:MAG: 16S rRNA processing protein RimM [Candidatus Latescibacterota bacterium]|nr:MAG: 16S rRNA processing protein RimM [Candidatus Latescibacterota bacterium]
MSNTVMTEVFLGRLVKAFGIRGEVKFHPSDDFWADALKSKHLVIRQETSRGIEERPITFPKCRQHHNSYIVRIEGVATRNQAEAMVGGEIFVDEENLDIDLPDRRLPFQVIGTTVKTEDGDVVGRVTSVVFSSAHDVYEVTGDEGSFLLPAVPEFIVAHDARKREMIVRLLPGLIDQ